MGTILCQVFSSNLGWTCFLGQVATNFALMLACYKIKDVFKNIAMINMAHIPSLLLRAATEIVLLTKFVETGLPRAARPPARS